MAETNKNNSNMHKWSSKPELKGAMNACHTCVPWIITCLAHPPQTPCRRHHTRLSAGCTQWSSSCGKTNNTKKNNRNKNHSNPTLLNPLTMTTSGTPTRNTNTTKTSDGSSIPQDNSEVPPLHIHTQQFNHFSILHLGGVWAWVDCMDGACTIGQKRQSQNGFSLLSL